MNSHEKLKRPEIILKSQWGSLSKHLLATICECDRKGKRKPGGVIVQCPILEFNIESQQQWSSKFEQSGIDSSAADLVQTGEAAEFLKKVGADEAAVETAKLEGRAGMTKLNSTQVYSGSTPIKISGQFFFRAHSNARSEVETPLDQLMRWHLPKELAENGSALLRLKEAGNVKEGVAALLPSLAPTVLMLIYQNNRYAPIVIESMQLPASPIDYKGNRAEVKIPFTAGTLRSLDAEDWRRLKWR